MPAKPEATALKCMNCGAPIKSGFFCARCQSGENDDLEIKGKGKADAWKGSRFSGEAKKKKQQALLKEDLTIWGKRLLTLAIVGGIGFAVYSLWGDQIVAWAQRVGGSTAPREKYDPTKDAQADTDDKGEATGSRAFTKQTK